MPHLTPAEREVHISKSADEPHWTVYITDSDALPHYLALAQSVGGAVFKHQGATKILLPEESVLLQRRRKLNLTPEQRATRAEQMKQRRAQKPASSVSPT